MRQQSAQSLKSATVAELSRMGVAGPGMLALVHIVTGFYLVSNQLTNALIVHILYIF